MTKKITIILAFALIGYSQINAQNVGIGNNAPDSKLDVVQTAGVIAVEIDHSGTDGNSIEIDQTGAANTSSGIWLKNGGLGHGINLNMLNAASTAVGLQVIQTGLGQGAIIAQLNTGAPAQALYIDQDGTNAISRGLQIDMDAANPSIGSSIFHEGTGIGSYIDLSNTTNTATGVSIVHEGTGRGQQIAMNNTGNSDIGLGVFHNGTGVGLNLATAVYGQTPGNAVVGISTGTDGTGGIFQVTDTTANRNGTGIFVLYEGKNNTGGGGGNAAEFRHAGTNATAVDIFMGDPSIAPGAANTTSDYAALTVAHMATGTSPTPGTIKSAISASNNSADPTILVSNNGTEDGDGLNIFLTPITGSGTASGGTPAFGATSAQAMGIYSQAADASGDEGVGVFGWGGDMGVMGYADGGSGYGIFSWSLSGAAGAKSFVIDHPLAPETKTLRHFSIESDEILNMYRGVVQLDANGQAEIELPAYFDAVNINPSYQLTGIGSSTQPYVATEIANNKFTVAGAPNTKVSWTVYAERNDPTIQYFKEEYNLSENVQDKAPSGVGKYITPQAYGQDITKGLMYSQKRAQLSEERMEITREEAVMQAPSVENKKVNKRTLKGEAKEAIRRLESGKFEASK